MNNAISLIHQHAPLWGTILEHPPVLLELPNYSDVYLMNLNCKQVCFSGGDSVLVAAVPWWRDEATAGARSLISVCSRAQGWWCWVFHNSAADVNLEKQVFCAFRRQRDSLLLTERQTVFNRVAFTTDQVLLSFPSVSFKALASKFMVIMFSVFPVAKEILSWLHFQRGKRKISLWWQWYGKLGTVCLR